MGHYLSFEVTPRAQDSSKAGEAELSWWIGPVEQINDEKTGITDIQVIYSGSNIMEGYSAGKKVYPLDFASTNDSTVTVRVSGGNNVVINGNSVSEDTIDFYDDTRLLEVTADLINNPGVPTSYFIVLNDEPIPLSINIEGEEIVELEEDDKTVRWRALVYDQYGEQMQENIEWDLGEIPDDYDYRIAGTHNDILTIDIPVDSSVQVINIKARVKNDETVFEEKTLQVNADPFVQLNNLTENLNADFAPVFTPSTYEYTLEADYPEAQVELTAALEDDTSAKYHLHLSGHIPLILTEK